MLAKSTLETGIQGERVFERFCFDRNILCFRPPNDTRLARLDYIIFIGNKLITVNVKTMFKEKRQNCYKVNMQTRNGEGKKRAYTEGEIDYFAIVNLDEREQPIWLLPLDATNGKTTLRWFPADTPHQKRVDSFNWEPYHIYSHDLGVNQNNLVKVR